MARRRKKGGGDILTAVFGFIAAIYLWQIVIGLLVIAAGVWLVVTIIRSIIAEVRRRQARKRLAALHQPLLTITTYTPREPKKSPPLAEPQVARCERCWEWLPSAAHFCRRCGRPQDVGWTAQRRIVA